MVNIREYQIGDIYKIFLNGLDQYHMQYVREDVLAAGISFTGTDNDGNIVGSAGLAELWEGVYEAWIALDERYKRDHLSILKILKKLLVEMPVIVSRIHAHVNMNTENQEKLMLFLGFEKEAILENYFPKKHNCQVWRRLY